MAMAEEQVQPGGTARGPGPASGDRVEIKTEVGVGAAAQSGAGAGAESGADAHAASPTEPAASAAAQAQAEAAAPTEPNPFATEQRAEGGGTRAQAAEGSGGPADANLSALLEDARAKADDHWDQLLRTRAEMENLRRRHALELEKAHKYALDSFVKDLLGVRDSLELALEAASKEQADLASLREGTELTLKQMADVMSRFGVERLDPRGEPFNPEYHQAMTLQPSTEVPPNTVTTVIQKGYVLNGRLVRPAMVIVSSAG